MGATMIGGKQDDNVYAKYLLRPFSGTLTRLFLLLGATPNEVTAMSFIAGLASVSMFLSGELMWGAAFFLLSYILDLSDGEVARATNTVSGRGAWLDETLDSIKDGLVYLSLAISQNTIALGMLAYIALMAHNMSWYLKKLYTPSAEKRPFKEWKTIFAPTGSMRSLALSAFVLTDIGLFFPFIIITHTLTYLKELVRR